MNMDNVITLYRQLLEEFHLDREDFHETPERVARMWSAFFTQHESCEMKHFETRSSGGIICIKNFSAWSFCPHHLLPVKYEMKIGYVPLDRAFGLSKLGRAAQCVMNIMPLQEDVACMIADQLQSTIKLKGIGIIVHGEHLCMRMRGLSDPCVSAGSDHFEGCMLEPEYQQRFFNI